MPNLPQEQMMVELKPCPLCGGEASSGYQGDEDGGYGFVECEHRSVSDGHFAGVHADSEEEAGRIWNTRAIISTGDDAGLDEDALMFQMLNELHANMPEIDRPMSLSDLSDEQTVRARKAVRAVLLGAMLSKPAGHHPNLRAAEEALGVSPSAENVRPERTNATNFEIGDDAGLVERLNEGVLIIGSGPGQSEMIDVVTANQAMRRAAAAILSLTARNKALEEALDDLQQAEFEYRLMHDRYGDGSQAAGRAWDLMRRAGTIRTIAHDRGGLSLHRLPR